MISVSCSRLTSIISYVFCNRALKRQNQRTSLTSNFFCNNPSFLIKFKKPYNEKTPSTRKSEAFPNKARQKYIAVKIWFERRALALFHDFFKTCLFVKVMIYWALTFKSGVINHVN